MTTIANIMHPQVRVKNSISSWPSAKPMLSIVYCLAAIACKWNEKWKISGQARRRKPTPVRSNPSTARWMLKSHRSESPKPRVYSGMVMIWPILVIIVGLPVLTITSKLMISWSHVYVYYICSKIIKLRGLSRSQLTPLPSTSPTI